MKSCIIAADGSVSEVVRDRRGCHEIVHYSAIRARQRGKAAKQSNAMAPVAWPPSLVCEGEDDDLATTLSEHDSVGKPG
jgi:hypothetical protein